MDRRQFLQTFGVGVLAAAPLVSALTSLREGVLTPPSTNGDPVAHAISRLTFGVTPTLYSYVKTMGATAYVAEQLAPENIDDSPVDQMLQPYADILNQNGGILDKQYGAMRSAVKRALLAAWTTHAVYSQRQLYERVVEFFSNHFHEYVDKDNVLFLKIDDEHNVIRPNVLTNFRQLLGATAHSPAMLVYLDNAENTRSVPNENYARELMELHTISVNGGYTETDVKEIARCLTGWSIDRPHDTADGSIHYHWRPLIHDNDAKTVLGTAIPAGGAQQDGETVLDLLARSPSTAQFISTKIARRFVSDTPPDSLVQRMAGTFQQTDGDIKSLLQTLFTADEFWGAPPKLKQPFEYVMSVLRALDFNITNDTRFLVGLGPLLNTLGQYPFEWVQPNGFPDVEDQWTGGLLARWNVALDAVNNQIPGARMNFSSILDQMQAQQVPMQIDSMVAFIGSYLLGRALTDEELTTTVDFARSTATDLQTQVAAGTALLLASPAFQYR